MKMKMTKEEFLEMCEQELEEQEEKGRKEKAQAIIDRNIQMYEDKLRRGYTYDRLAEKYGLTRERCRQIVMKECRKHEWADNTVNTLFCYYPDISRNIVVRSFNGFCRMLIGKNENHDKLYSDFAFFCSQLAKVTDEELCNARNLGRKSVTFLSTVRSDFGDLESEDYITVSDLIKILEVLPRTAPVLFKGKVIEGVADILGEGENDLGKKVVVDLS